MEAATVTQKRPAKRRDSRTHRRTAFDQFLVESRISATRLDLILAVATPYTDEDGWCLALVSHVDVFSVKFEVWKPGSSKQERKEVWISKAQIVSVGPADD